jgi:hypothetical protein
MVINDCDVNDMMNKNMLNEITFIVALNDSIVKLWNDIRLWHKKPLLIFNIYEHESQILNKMRDAGYNMYIIKNIIGTYHNKLYILALIVNIDTKLATYNSNIRYIFYKISV